MRGIVFGVLVLSLMSVSGSSKGVIKEYYPFLIGKYQLVQVVTEKGIRSIAGETDTYELEVKANDLLVLLKNGKKVKRCPILSMRSPMEDNEDYVLFLDGEDNYPLHFAGDTVMTFLWPYNYDDNYFKRVSK
jgi:hypothetical protein